MTDYKYDNKIITYDIQFISPIIELKRYQLINKIKDECKILLKDWNIDINNILPRWIFLQFSTGNHFVDPLFPSNGRNNAQLKKDLYYLSKKQFDNSKIDELIVKLDFENKFNLAIIELKKFIDSEYFKENDDLINIITTHENDYTYYELHLQNNYNFGFTLLKFKLNNKLLNKCLSNYKLIHSSANLNDKKFLRSIMCLILRYNTLESYNQQLAVNPEFYEFLKRKYKINFELFASSLNCNYDNYCSLFYDLEKEFNSLGNFNLLTIKQGFYTANPPFDEEIMKNMAMQLINMINNTSNSLSIFITIPAWNNNDYDDYEVLTLLKKSNLIKFIKRIPKNSALFYDYYKNRYIYPCDIYFILISNVEYNLSLESDINTYFKPNNFKKNMVHHGGYNNKYICIKHKKYIPFTNKIMYKNEPLNYNLKNIKKYYLKKAKENNKYLTDYKTFIKDNKIKIHSKSLIKIYLENIYNDLFNNDMTVKNILMVDLTYSCDNNGYIIERLKQNYDVLSNHLLKKNVLTIFTVDYMLNPRYNKMINESKTKQSFFFENIHNNEKYDFIFVSGNIEYFVVKSISYFSEQISSMIHFIQLYILLSTQNINGSFIFFIYTCDTDIYRNYITLLQNYYEEIYLYKLFDINANIMYIVGKNFLGINNDDLDKLKNMALQIVTKDYKLGENINVYDDKLRKKYYVNKHLSNKSSNMFIHNVFKFKKNNKFINEYINTFNKFFI
jgi:hypothetical protein